MRRNKRTSPRLVLTAWLIAASVATAQTPAGKPATAAPDAQPSPAVAEAIATVRAEPPANERAEPWMVPVPELTLELQPLTKTQVEERVQAWRSILQQAVAARIRMDIALTRVEGDVERRELADRSAAQQQIVLATAKRMEAALTALEERGGDVKEYKQYIASATGQQLNLSDFGVLSAQGFAWIRSPEGGVRIGLNILKFLVTLIVFWLVSRILGAITASAVERLPKASSMLRSFLVGGVRWVALLIGVIIAVSALGVNITPLVAAIGAAGLVIGFALQGTLSNFASGVLILIYRPYDIGDVIAGGGVTGKVESMNLVSTRILTFDNQVMIVPNNSIWGGVITNVTGRDTRRVDLKFGIAYSDDIAKAVSVIEEALTGHPKVLDDPAPVVRVHELADSSVNIIARPWSRTADYWDVYWDVTRTVKERFDAEGVHIPFPQRDLHLPGSIEVRIAGDGRARGGDVGREPPVVEVAGGKKAAGARREKGEG